MKASLVSAKELHGRNLAGSVQIFDCRFALNDPDAGRAAFEGQGIPGANYVDLEEDLSGTIGADTARHPLPSPNAWLGKVAHLGLNSDKMIVAYDDGHGMFAARLWWMLSWIGLENVCLLDGVLPNGLSLAYPLRPAMIPWLLSPQNLSGCLITGDMSMPTMSLPIWIAKRP